ncbi:MAG: hypothetical protein PVF28_07120 [Thioalkalispiraceae bacterium]
MSNLWISIFVGIAILVISIPIVIRIRHPQQKPLAAYLIFITVFVLIAFFLFSLLMSFITNAGLETLLHQPLLIILFHVLVFIPALVVAIWLAAKPPWRQGPPN